MTDHAALTPEHVDMGRELVEKHREHGVGCVVCGKRADECECNENKEATC